MKKTVNFLLFLLFAFNTIACNNTQSNNKLTSDDNTTKIEKIEVYYFHYTRRCATCIAVENETKKILKELYPEKIKNEQIIFQSINLDQGKSEELAEKYILAGAIPYVKKGDALHIAIATLSKMDILVSWNCEHIVRFKTQEIVRTINLISGLPEISINTPKEVIKS